MGVKIFDTPVKKFDGTGQGTGQEAAVRFFKNFSDIAPDLRSCLKTDENMHEIIINAQSLYDSGTQKRAEQMWGEAINLYMDCIHALDGFASEVEEEQAEAFRLREKATAAIEFIDDIRGFVNTDLMNP